MIFSLMQLLENMTEVVRKGIIEAEQQLLKANEDKMMEEVCLNMYFGTFTLLGRRTPA